MNRRIVTSFMVLKTRKRFTNYFVPHLLFTKFFKKNRSHVGLSHYIMSSFLPSILLVKAFFKTEKSAHLKLISEADDLYNAAEYEKLYVVLDSHRQSDDPEILWRLARAIFERCRNLNEAKEKLLNLEEALQLVDKALEISDNCWAAHKWRAILLDYVWRYKSTKGRIIHSFEVKKHMERAIELNPEDSTSYYLLGEWCFTFADMPWYQRKVAAAIFASPPTSTYEEALQYFQTAEKISPLFYSMNLLMIGKCLLKLNDEEKGIVYIKKVINYPVKTADDKQAHEEAEKLLKSLNVS